LFSHFPCNAREHEKRAAIFYVKKDGMLKNPCLSFEKCKIERHSSRFPRRHIQRQIRRSHATAVELSTDHPHCLLGMIPDLDRDTPHFTPLSTSDIHDAWFDGHQFSTKQR
jgi:hypothetical protein